MSETQNQIVLTPKLDSLPSILKNLNQWVNWNVGESKDGGRYNKIPVNKNGRAINAHDSSNWLSLEEAFSNTQLLSITGGIAFDLSGKSLELNEVGHLYLVGGDIDECVTLYQDGKEPQLTNGAQEIVKMANTYYEVSPSGTGIRFFFCCEKTPKNKNLNGHEIYYSGRFLTITGHGWGDIKTLTPTKVEQIIGLMFPTSEVQKMIQHQPQPPLKQNNLKTIHFTAGELERFESALASIPANLNRDEWRSIIFSIKAHDLPDGEDRAKQWSLTAGIYDPRNNKNGYSEDAFNNVWKCSPKTIGKATLYYRARQYGWQGIQGELFKPNQIASNIDVYGDIFNGKAFNQLHEGQMLYCYPRNKWLKFDGIVWTWCDGGEDLNAAKSTAQYITQMAADVFSQDPTNPNSKKFIQHAQNTHNVNRLEAMLKVAAAEPNMGIGNMNMLDSSPMLLGCKNGIIDLSTGHLLFPQPEMLITRQAQTNYIKDAIAPNWLKFLDQCFLGDQDTIDYIQKAVGYSLTGSVKEEALFFCYGIGRNGKSVFANIITRLMGDYVLTAPSEMLMRRDRNSATNDIARLCGSRLVLANETRSDQRFDDLTIKQLVSTERITARFLHNEFFEFWPTFKIWIRGNHKPLVTDESEGAWRRIKLIPFENNLSESEIDPHLEDKLMAELEGILAWAVEGSIKWQQEGLTPSPRIKAASNEYRKDCDIIGEFILELCTLGIEHKVAQSSLWFSWEMWAKSNGYRSGSKKSFTRRLKDRGITDSIYLGGARAYGGIKIGATPSQDQGGNSTKSSIDFSHG